MSSHVWNTALQQWQLQALISATQNAIAAEEDCSTSSSSAAEFLSSSSDGSVSALPLSTVGYLWKTTKKFALKLYTPVVDTTIWWHQQHCIIDNFTNSASLNYFRFAKDYLKSWPNCFGQK